MMHVALVHSSHCYVVVHGVAISQLILSPDGHRAVSRILLSLISLPPCAHAGASLGCQLSSTVAVSWAKYRSRFIRCRTSVLQSGANLYSQKLGCLWELGAKCTI